MPKIFDNREQLLLPELQQALKHAYRADFCVGYFNLRGWSQLADQVAEWPGRVEYDEFYPRHSKPIIDEIDRVLAQHYGFSDEELDYIINHDIKFRMGGADDDEGDEA